MKESLPPNGESGRGEADIPRESGFCSSGRKSGKVKTGSVWSRVTEPL